jgi:hypothetical protein
LDINPSRFQPPTLILFIMYNLTINCHIQCSLLITKSTVLRHIIQQTSTNDNAHHQQYYLQAATTDKQPHAPCPYIQSSKIQWDPVTHSKPIFQQRPFIVDMQDCTYIAPPDCLIVCLLEFLDVSLRSSYVVCF